MNPLTQLQYTSLEDLLGYYYDTPHEINQNQLWNQLAELLKVTEESMIPSLYTSESFLCRVFKFYTSLPYRRSIRKVVKACTKYLDPSPYLLRTITQQLVGCLQGQIPCLSTLNVCLCFYNSVFEQQRPANQNLDSHIYLYGPEEGIRVDKQIKWPFEKGGTLGFWFNMSDKTKECKLFEFLTAEGIGFEIFMKNRKIYIQKEDNQTKFRLIKNTSSYLCDAVFGQNVKLIVEFEIKKKFFQPYLSINLIMNNFVLNGVEIDSFPINANLFTLRLFKGFQGRFYSSLILTDKLASQVDEMNNQKGFIYDNDIRNFSYLFETNTEQVLSLLSCIRAVTQFEQPKPPAQKQEDNLIEDQLKQPIFIATSPVKTTLYDAIGSMDAKICSKACCYLNLSISKQIGNYGGFQSLMPFLELLEICCGKDELYEVALNQFLELVKLIFENKTDSIEKACQIHFFKQLARFIDRTRMQGFSYETITRLKQIYIALNTRKLREKYIQEVVWGIDFGHNLNEQNFSNYIKFIKTFYNEDIQSSLHAFNTDKIFSYVLEKLDIPECCFEHTGVKNTCSIRLKNYPKILQGIFEVVENILLIKRSENSLNEAIKSIIHVFGLSVSPCYIKQLIDFINDLFAKDNLLEAAFNEQLQRDSPDSKFYLYKCLSCCTSWETKAKIIEFILKLLEPNFFEEEKKDRELLTLCARYPTMSYRTSSIKSQENRDSIDYSEQKLSLNSATMHKLIIINPITNIDEALIDNFCIIEVIYHWAFSEKVLKLTSQESENPGLLVLMELYKGSTYRVRERISKYICDQMKSIRFSPELMAWAIECALIAEYDLGCAEEQSARVEGTKHNLLEIIGNYMFMDVEEDDNNELSIIKLVFSSVKSKYPDEIVKVAGNKLFFIICEKKIQIFVNMLKNQDIADIESYDRLCWRVVSNVFTFMHEYYVIKGDDDEGEFDEDSAEIAELENSITLEIMDKILQIFVFLATINDRKIIEEANAQRNHLVITMIFPEREKEKERVNIMFQAMFALQNIFDFYEVTELEPKKKCLLLIKKYLIYVIELTENSGSFKIQSFEQELKQLFLLSISFLQHKYFQFFYYPFEKHKNLDFHIENKIRKNIQDLKSCIYNIFLDLIDLIQYIDEKGNLQHKSFYQIMKPKRKPVHKYALKHIYPNFWKKVDEKIIEFLSLKRQILRKDAHQKLQSHILLKKVSHVSSNIEKVNAKKVFDFVEIERKQSQNRQKKSVNFYKMAESEKCRKYCICQQELTQFRIKISEFEKIHFTKEKQYKEQERRMICQVKQKIWNQNRTFNGFWTNAQFFQFCQGQPLNANNSLRAFYRRKRSPRLSKYFLAPLVQIEAIYKPISQNSQETSYASHIFLEGLCQEKPSKKRVSQKFIHGLQFIKKKVVSKLVRTITSNPEIFVNNQGEGEKVLVENVLWVKPMKVFSGYLKVQTSKICFCHKQSKSLEHISLFKNSLEPSDLLIQQWNFCDFEGLQSKTYLLKRNSIEIYLKNRKSIFLCFYGATEQQYENILAKISKLFTYLSPDQLLLAHMDPIRTFDKSELTQKWLNYEISNLQYLLCLNIASGRTYADLNQYPVFPWVMSQYYETKVKKNENKHRDLGKNTAQLGSEERIKKFLELYNNIAEDHAEEFPVAHHYGFHYSNLGITLQYLIRISPYTEGAKCLQGGKFDITDRLFYSIPESFRCATTEMSDLRELIPEFFYLPDFLINYEQLDFGKLQCDQSRVVSHVELPDGCLNAYDFIEIHREQLQSKEVSLNLHKWIDLIFGYKNSGKQAQRHMNVYHYLTNEANADKLDQIDDVQLRQSLESQMAYYGKTPSQLFTRPHPQRQSKVIEQFQFWDRLSFNTNQQFARHYEAEDERLLPQIICLSYCEKTKKYTLLSRNGKGVVFRLEKQEFVKVNQFMISLDKVEGIKILHSTLPSTPVESIEAQSLAIGGLWGGKIFTFNIMGCSYDIIHKHTDTVTCLRYSCTYGLLFSGANNGELCKFYYRDKRVQFHDKAYLHSRVNTIKIDTDLKLTLACTQDCKLHMLALQSLETVRTLLLPHPVVDFALLRYPFYTLFVLCRPGHQYCYSLNGIQLQQSQLQQCDNVQCMQLDCCRQRVLLRMGRELLFLRMPELAVEERLEVGDGGGFRLVAGEGELVVLNEGQVMVWRRGA